MVKNADKRTDKKQKWFRQSSLFSSFVSTSHNAVYMDMKTIACDSSTACSDSADIRKWY